MMTLRELKDVVTVADMKTPIPKAGTLINAGIPVVVKEVINADTQIMVFENGYVLYIAGDHNTVFPLHNCDGYEYKSVADSSQILKGDFFENENWYMRLLLEGEDRITNNRAIYHNRFSVSYHDIAEDLGMMEDRSHNVEKNLIEREMVKEILSFVDEKAAKAISDYYQVGKKQYEIGEEIQMDCKAVSKLIRRNVMKIRRNISIETSEVLVKKK